MIYEVKSYSDDEGRRITERIAKNVRGATIIGMPPKYTGIVVIKSAEIGNIPISFEFPVNWEYDLVKCFEEFDKFAEAKLQEIKNS